MYALTSLDSYVICTLQTFSLFMPMYISHNIVSVDSIPHSVLSFIVEANDHVCLWYWINFDCHVYVSERENCHFRKYIYRKKKLFIHLLFICSIFEIKSVFCKIFCSLFDINCRWTTKHVYVYGCAWVVILNGIKKTLSIHNVSCYENT